MLGDRITKDRWEYQRLLNTYQPRCDAKGRNKATCILLPNHEGDWHEGQGHDAHGPMYVQWRKI